MSADAFDAIIIAAEHADSPIVPPSYFSPSEHPRLIIMRCCLPPHRRRGKVVNIRRHERHAD